jgi:Fic family protein
MGKDLAHTAMIPTSTTLLNVHRAGRYLRSASGHSAYLPARLMHALAPSFNLCERLLPEADRALARLDGALSAAADADAIAAMLRRKEAVCSSQLDGLQVSLIDLLDREAGLMTVGGADEVAQAKVLSDQLSERSFTASAEQLQRLQASLFQLTHQKPAGFRSVQAWVGVAGATLAEARYVPPPPAEIPALLADWQQFIAETHNLHPLLKLALATAQLDSIHPFLEANGRVTRAFVLLQLKADGLLSHSGALLWSGRWQRERQQASEALHQLRTQGDVDAWVQWFLKAVTRAAQDSCELVLRIAALRERHRSAITAEFGRVVPQALCVIDAATTSHVLTIKNIIELTATSFPAANELALKLQRAGLLVEITGNARNRRFRCAPYVRVFVDDELT